MILATGSVEVEMYCKLKEIELITMVLWSPSYSPSFEVVIPPSKDVALPLAVLINVAVPVRVYSDGSGFEGGIGAATMLYINERLVKMLWVYLGTAMKHTVYEAEGIGLVMGLHLLKGLIHQLTEPTVKQLY
jgi:hypothetical protein